MPRPILAKQPSWTLVPISAITSRAAAITRSARTMHHLHPSSPAVQVLPHHHNLLPPAHRQGAHQPGQERFH
uniref:Putative secreted peptide n=1 Tax=Anopheles braziliensis TaxID=58242 RepID=A0A2M3ZUP5_9DIPT